MDTMTDYVKFNFDTRSSTGSIPRTNSIPIRKQSFILSSDVFIASITVAIFYIHSFYIIIVGSKNEIKKQ